MDFWKMHGTGNDFILINNIDSKFCCGSSGKDKPDNVEGIECAAYAGLAGIAKKVCSRHFGIGADGLIAAEASETADIRMVYYNSDGSAAAMCGNGIRCFTKFVRDCGIVNKDSFSVETCDGIKKVSIVSHDDVVSVVRAEMGFYSCPENIKIPLSDKTVLNDLTVSKDLYENRNWADLVCMNVGVPHCVMFLNNISESRSISTIGNDIDSFNIYNKDTKIGIDSNDNGRRIIECSGINTGEINMSDNYAFPEDLAILTGRLGPEIEKNPAFPEGTNVNFVSVINDTSILTSTWERGAGRTLACGTGACASAAAAYLYMGINPEVRVRMPGGDVNVVIAGGGALLLEGPAALICKGTFFL